MNYQGAKLRAGDLRQSLSFYSPQHTINAYGESEYDGSNLVATVRGNLWAVGSPDSREALNESSNTAVRRAVCAVRACDVTPMVGWSVINAGVQWQIKGVRDPLGVGDSWECDLVYREEVSP